MTFEKRQPQINRRKSLITDEAAKVAAIDVEVEKLDGRPCVS